MQQLALQQTTSTLWPTKMTALERDARDSSHAHGGGRLLAFDGLVESSNAQPKRVAAFSSSHAVKLSDINGTPGVFSGLEVGDVVESAISIAAGALTGGPVGALTALAGEVFEATSGDGLIGHALSLFSEEAPKATTLAHANRAYLGADGLR